MINELDVKTQLTLVQWVYRFLRTREPNDWFTATDIRSGYTADTGVPVTKFAINNAITKMRKLKLVELTPVKGMYKPKRRKEDGKDTGRT